MRRGRHAADDGSFGRSAGTALGRGLALLAVAVVLGAFLLNRVDEPVDGDNIVSGGDDTEETTTTTTAPEQVTTTTAPAKAPKDVRVLTANGTSVRGAAGRVKERLMAAGYNTLAATDAAKKPASTAVFFAAGFEREAAAIAQLLSLSPPTVQPMPAPPPVSDLKAANVLVMVGSDLAQPGGAATSSTTSTAARAGATSTTTSTTR